MNILRRTLLIIYIIQVYLNRFVFSTSLDTYPALAMLSIMVLAAFAFVILHSIQIFGKRNTAIFLIITFAISFIMESVGVSTGLVFGHYHYTENLGPKILGVPPAILLAYFVAAYTSLILAKIFFGFYTRVKGPNVWGIIIISSFYMLAWDICMDPYSSTISKNWIWEQGGAYFGVPVHNFIGWFVTVFIIFTIYLKYESRNPSVPSEEATKKNFWLEPVIMYGLLGFSFVLKPIIGKYPTDMEWTIALIAVFTMCLITIQAVFKLNISNEPDAEIGENSHSRTAP